MDESKDGKQVSEGGGGVGVVYSSSVSCADSRSSECLKSPSTCPARRPRTHSPRSHRNPEQLYQCPKLRSHTPDAEHRCSLISTAMSAMTASSTLHSNCRCLNVLGCSNPGASVSLVMSIDTVTPELDRGPTTVFAIVSFLLPLRLPSTRRPTSFAALLAAL